MALTIPDKGEGDRDEWLRNLKHGDDAEVSLVGEPGAVRGKVVFCRGDQVAVRLEDGRLVKFIGGVRLRGSGEQLEEPRVRSAGEPNSP